MWAVFDTQEQSIKWLFSSLDKAVEMAARMDSTTFTARHVPKRTG